MQQLSLRNQESNICEKTVAFNKLSSAEVNKC